MGPRQYKFWLPLTRLGAFFVAVVVSGNVVLHAFRPETADTTTSPDRSVDYYSKKKKRLERQFQKTMERFLGAPAAVEKVGVAPLDIAPPVLCAAPAVQPPVAMVPLTPQISATSTETAAAATVLVDAPSGRPAAEPPPKSAVLAFLSPEPAAFVWPEPLPAIPPRVLDLPTSLAVM